MMEIMALGKRHKSNEDYVPPKANNRDPSGYCFPWIYPESSSNPKVDRITTLHILRVFN